MPSLRDVRRHIKSVKNIQQITYAMKMVAAARIKRAQSAILSSRPFAVKMEEMLADLGAELNEDDFKTSGVCDLFEGGFYSDSVGLLLITSDKGLCGSFNANLLKAAVKWLRENREKKIYCLAIGKKGRDFLRRLKNLNLEMEQELIGIFPKISYAHAEMTGEAVTNLYRAKKTAKITVIYNEFKSLIAQRIVCRDLLPLEMHIAGLPAKAVVAGKTSASGEKLRDFNFEPGKNLLLRALLPRYIKAQIYRMLLESQSAELAARMNAMESANKNAGELIDALTLKLNKTRQAMITKELSEIVGGAEALGG
ncbi:MAG: ATP synthase F1 subunit gamma [Elusimicrobia bacterium]|nr:ATP synthase F1 subunit gamma [Elusimicrobiota bacterium]